MGLDPLGLRAGGAGMGFGAKRSFSKCFQMADFGGEGRTGPGNWGGLKKKKACPFLPPEGVAEQWYGLDHIIAEGGD